MVKKSCLRCQLEVKRLSPKAKYCSNSCKYKAYRQGISEKPSVKCCENCGASFFSKNTSKYCSKKCGDISYRKRNHERLREGWKKYRIKSGRSKTIYFEGMTNICLRCQNKFSPKANTPFQKYCSKSCRNKTTIERWNKNNILKLREYQKKYDSSEKRKLSRQSQRYKDWRRDYYQRWLKDNPTKSADYSKSYRERDPERARTVSIKFKKSIKGILLNRKRSHIQRMLIRKNYDHNKLIPLLKEYNNKCPLCQTEYNVNLSNMELGHIFPLKKYDSLAAETDNFLPICKRCNRKMRDKIFSDYCKLHNIIIPKRVLDYEEHIKNQKTLL